MDLIEQIGPFVGLAAFVALAVLAFLLFQQSRELRRLREWAGRAPERAKEAAEASLAAAELRGDETASEEVPGAVAQWWAGVKESMGPRLENLDRRLPIDGRIILGLLGALVIAGGVLTSGFGLLGDGGGREGKQRAGQAAKKKERDERPKVAILNATQTEDVQGVPGLADKVASEVVKQLGYPLGTRTNAPAGFAESVVMFEPSAEGEAAELARAISKQLGETATQPMAADIRAAVEDSTIVLVVGADDAQF